MPLLASEHEFDWFEQRPVFARFALHAQLVAVPGEVGEGVGANADHCRPLRLEPFSKKLRIGTNCEQGCGYQRLPRSPCSYKNP